MEVIHLHIEMICRSHGRSAVQMAAYCGRDKLYCDHTGETYDYTSRTDLVYHEVLLPDHAPKDFYNPLILWNSVEKIEKSRNAQLARSIILALPKEIDRNHQIEMACRYVTEQFVQRGMCADVSIHDKGDKNPHVHVLLTTRSLDKEGKWMAKQRKNKRYDAARKRNIFGKSIKINDWDERRNVEIWRKAWADCCNRYCSHQGVPREFTHSSYVSQGIDREATKHLGAKVNALQKRGKFPDRWKENERIKQRNKKRDRQHFLERDLERSHEDDRSR